MHSDSLKYWSVIVWQISVEKCIIYLLFTFTYKYSEANFHIHFSIPHANFLNGKYDKYWLGPMKWLVNIPWWIGFGFYDIQKKAKFYGLRILYFQKYDFGRKPISVLLVTSESVSDAWKASDAWEFCG